MKFLIIGFGKMGMLHAATLRTLPGASEVVIAETSPLVRRAIGVFAPRARVLDDYRAVLSEGGLAGAVIATPTASHIPIFKELLPHVPRIFVEKPFASNFAEAAAAAGPAALSGGTAPSVMVGHCLRFSSVFLEAKRILGTGVLQDLTGFEASMFSSDVLRPSRSWRFKDARSGGGVLLDLGSHLVDMTRFFFGTPARLTGTIGSLVSTCAEDFFESDWSYPQGLRGKLTCSWSKPDFRKALLHIRIAGQNGRMEVSDDGIELDLKTGMADFSAGTSRIAVTSLESSVPFDLAGPMYTRQLMQWAAGPVHTNTLAENLINLRLIDAIRSSAGREIPFE